MKILKKTKETTHERSETLIRSVSEIIEKVKADGDSVLLEMSEKFDGVKLAGVTVSKEEIASAYDKIDGETLDAIRFAADQIRFFAEKQRACLTDLNVESKVAGLTLGHRVIPVESVGCYIPSGLHPLPSTALMTIIPAKIAGVKKVIATAPAAKEIGGIHPAILVAMDIAGADEIYCAGGAQAVAAMAYGTETIPAVSMIVGPGNSYVAEAKRQVRGDVAIESVAGPSEVLIIADETADPTFVAIDLLGQAEHAPDTQAVLVTTSEPLCGAVEAEIERLLPTLSNRETASISWENNGSMILADSLDEAIDIANDYAPEHLEVQTADCRAVAERLENYGSLFIGHYAAVTLGDFVSGTNHTLPTMRSAKFSSGLWVGSFLKVAFHQYVTEEGCRNLSKHCMQLAEVEGLDAHRDTIRLRVEK